MRTLTAEEVSKELNDIDNREWPMGLVLPVKNLYDGRLGQIRRGVFQGIVSEVLLADGSKVPFPTLRAMIEAGWVAD